MLCLCYGWTPPRLPSHRVCGSDFSIPLSCPHGAFPTITTFVTSPHLSYMMSVCHDVKIKPVFQQLSGENLRFKTAVRDNDAHLDISATGFWGARH